MSAMGDVVDLNAARQKRRPMAVEPPSPDVEIGYSYPGSEIDDSRHPFNVAVEQMRAEAMARHPAGKGGRKGRHLQALQGGQFDGVRGV